MKTFRKVNHYANGYWARFMREERKQKRLHKYCVYNSTRKITCARAAWMVDRKEILSKRYPIRNFYGKRINKS